jgi:rare lipoprotein A
MAPTGREEHIQTVSHYPFVCICSFVSTIMRLPSRVGIAVLSAWIGIHVNPAAAQSFDDRWSIVPKAHAEPPPEADKYFETAPQTQYPAAAPTRDPEDQSVKRSFSGTASFYSYRTGKTANGSLFDRDSPTAAHRTLPFGTRVRVTNLENNRSVIVTITDRGPNTPGRVLDLSLDAARTLGIMDRGVVEVRADVL